MTSPACACFQLFQKLCRNSGYGVYDRGKHAGTPLAKRAEARNTDEPEAAAQSEQKHIPRATVYASTNMSNQLSSKH
jgi:hypothetical protein